MTNPGSSRIPRLSVFTKQSYVERSPSPYRPPTPNSSRMRMEALKQQVQARTALRKQQEQQRHQDEDSDAEVSDRGRNLPPLGDNLKMAIGLAAHRDGQNKEDTEEEDDEGIGVAPQPPVKSSKKGKSRRVSPDPQDGDNGDSEFEQGSPLPERPVTPVPRQLDQVEDVVHMLRDLTPRTRRAAVAAALGDDEEAPEIPVVESDEDVEYDNVYAAKVSKLSKDRRSGAAVAKPQAESFKRQRSPQELTNLKRSRLDKAAALQHSFSDSNVLRGQPFRTGTLSTASVDLPSIIVINKLRQSMYVPLWHFSQEGIIEGHARDASIQFSSTPTLTMIIDSLGANAQLGDHKKEDWAMSFHEMSAAFKILWKTYDKLIAEARDESKEWLELERDHFKKMWDEVENHDYCIKLPGWPWLALYVHKVRHDYFKSPYGQRLDPGEWQDKIFKRAGDDLELLWKQHRAVVPAPEAV
ncbi:hypothetical protein CF326_g8362, partial [Tilletia indica]